MTKTTQTKPDAVICINNEGYAVSLERLKVYFAYPNAADEKLGLLRVMDESGDSYLYPKSLFLALPQARAAASKMKAAMAVTIKGRIPKRKKKEETPRRAKTAA